MRLLLEASAVYLLVAASGGIPSSLAWTAHQNPLSFPASSSSVRRRRSTELARRRQLLLRVRNLQNVKGFEDFDRTRTVRSGASASTTSRSKKPERIRPTCDDKDEPEQRNPPPSREGRRTKFRFDAVDARKSIPTHLFKHELQHLVRNGKVRDGKTVAEQAEELLLARVTNPDDALSYDTVSFNIVLQAWANQRAMTAALRADNLLSLMLRTGSIATRANNTRTGALVQADAYSYAAVLNGYAKSGGKMKAALRATELLEQFERSSVPIVTSDVCHNAAMNAWAVSGSPQAGDRAERILRQLLGIKTVQPTRIAFNACIKAYAKAGQPAEAQRLLDQMKALSADAHPNLTPDKITYSSCIDAWSRSFDCSSDAAGQAERLLAEMEEAFVATGDVNIQPDVVSYTSVLSAFAQSGSIHHNKAQKLLERMRLHAQDGPNAPFLNAWIHLLARTSSARNNETSGSKAHAAAAAEEILEYMQVEYARGDAGMKPCKITYTAVITVLAHVGTADAARRAEGLLDELQTTWERTSDDDFLPNAKTFTSALNAWAKSGSPSAVESAENLVRRMEELHERTKSVELEPSLVVFLQVFQVLANSRSNDAAEKAKNLLQKMHRLHLNGFPDVRPDATTYAYLINAFTKSRVGNVADLATVVLTEAEEGYRAGIGSLKPTALLYSAVLQAYAKCSSARGAQLAEQLLDRTKELYRQGKLYAKPTTLFCTLIKCFLMSSARPHFVWTHDLLSCIFLFAWLCRRQRGDRRARTERGRPGLGGARRGAAGRARVSRKSRRRLPSPHDPHVQRRHSGVEELRGRARRSPPGRGAPPAHERRPQGGRRGLPSRPGDPQLDHWRVGRQREREFRREGGAVLGLHGAVRREGRRLAETGRLHVQQLHRRPHAAELPAAGAPAVRAHEGAARVGRGRRHRRTRRRRRRSQRGLAGLHHAHDDSSGSGEQPGRDRPPGSVAHRARDLSLRRRSDGIVVIGECTKT
jgi:pentatricopeptide repeat protein